MRGKVNLKSAKALVAVAAAMAVVPAAALGMSSTAPFNHDFGAHTIGTTSPPQTFTLTVRCTPDPPNPNMCTGAPEPLTPNVTVTGPFAIQDNTCTTTMPGSTTFGTSCTFKVVYKPVSTGEAVGIIDVGDPGGFGKAAVRGTGVALPATPPPGAGSTVGPKKCKKGFRLVKKNGKRKCKRKRR